MAKLYFYYGAMGASKTANLLMVDFNYKERHQNTIILKPEIDTRDGNDIIKSRAGLFCKADVFNSDTSIIGFVQKAHKERKVDCILIDEAQFLNERQVKELAEIVDEIDIPVMCYGLRSDFKGNLFEGSQWLLALAEKIEEIKTVCWCGKKAIMNARVHEGRVVKEGEQIKIGGNESYISLCRKHWRNNALK